MSEDQTMQIDHAMLLAAGLGTRMRPLTDQIPKPLVKVNGKALIDYNLDKLRSIGILNAVVNVHHLAEQVEDHCSEISSPNITISDERVELLDSGGGIAKALPILGQAPFIVMNCDTFWSEANSGALSTLVSQFDPENMDFLLLLAQSQRTTGYDGHGDFFMDEKGLLERRGQAISAPFVFAGAYICNPNIFEKCPRGSFSVIQLFDKAVANGRLFGQVLDGHWFHVGTVDAIAQVEEALARLK